MKVQIERIKNQIIEGDLQGGLNLLLEGTKNSRFESESMLLISRYNKMNKEKHSYTLDEDKELKEHNKIIVTILELLNRMIISFFENEVIFEDLLFYETSFETLTSKQSREYKTTFDKNETRHVGWELNMQYPKVMTTINFVIKWRFVFPNDNLKPIISTDFSFQNSWANSNHSNSWGFDNYGKWKEGIYNVELQVMGKKIVGKFRII